MIELPLALARFCREATVGACKNVLVLNNYFTRDACTKNLKWHTIQTRTSYNTLPSSKEMLPSKFWLTRFTEEMKILYLWSHWA